MQKACRALAETAGRFLFIGISVQIVLGICWMIRSFGIFPEFGDSYLWLAAAGTFVCDDYMGIGYPLFLMLAKGIEAVSSIPYTFFCLHGTDFVRILQRCGIFTFLWRYSEKMVPGLGKSWTFDVSVCHAVPSGSAAEFCGIFLSLNGTGSTDHIFT